MATNDGGAVKGKIGGGKFKPKGDMQSPGKSTPGKKVGGK